MSHIIQDKVISISVRILFQQMFSILFLFIKYMEDWRDSPEFNSTFCFSTEPEFDSQHVHGESQPSITHVPGDQCPLLASRNIRHACSTQTYMHLCTCVSCLYFLRLSCHNSWPSLKMFLHSISFSHVTTFCHRFSLFLLLSYFRF